MAIELTDIGGTIVPGTAYIEEEHGSYLVFVGVYGSNAYPDDRITLLWNSSPLLSAAQLDCQMLNAEPETTIESLCKLKDAVQPRRLCKHHRRH